MSINLKITGLHPVLMDALSAMNNEVKARNLSFEPFHTLRTHAEQQRIYMKGRDIINLTGRTPAKPMGLIVSNAPAFWSDHEWGLAVDFVPKDTHGNWTWNWPDERWDEIGQLGKALGLKWGGDWRSPDKPHFYLKRKITMAEVRKIFFTEGIDAVWKAVI